MSKRIFAAVISVFCFSLAAMGQESPDDAVAVERTVSVYLAKADLNSVKKSLAPNAKIISVDAARGRMTETPISKPATATAGKVTQPVQRIMNIDIVSGGATVKVESDFTGTGGPSADLPKHIHFISLLKIGGEWKIVSILMPPLAFSQTAVN